MTKAAKGKKRAKRTEKAVKFNNQASQMIANFVVGEMLICGELAGVAAADTINFLLKSGLVDISKKYRLENG